VVGRIAPQKIIVVKSREEKPGCNPTESLRKAMVKKRAVFLMMMMMIFTLQAMKGWSYI
jgi:hypothetical protein